MILDTDIYENGKNMKKIMYEQIYEDIINDIKNGIYNAKDILPSEKELAMKYNVSRITTGKAMSLLVDQGIVERVRGKGTFVCENVARILNGEKGEIQEGCVQEAPQTLDMLGVIIDAFDLDFGTHLLKGIERECSRNHMSMMLRCTYGSTEEENAAIREALSCGCKGLLLMTVQGEIYNDMILKLVLNKIPVVLLDREMKGLGIPCVKTNNYKATWELTQALIERGHRKICLVTHMYENTPTIVERNNAFRDCMMQDARCRGSVKVLRSYSANPEGLIESLEGVDLSEVEEFVAQEDCTAFISVEYKLGMLLQEACDKLGLKRKICVFDDLHPIYNKGRYFMHVKQNDYLMGVEAVKSIRRIIDGESTEMMVYVPYKIVE